MCGDRAGPSGPFGTTTATHWNATTSATRQTLAAVQRYRGRIDAQLYAGLKNKIKTPQILRDVHDDR